MSGFIDADHYQNQMAYSNWPPSKEISQKCNGNAASGPQFDHQTFNPQQQQQQQQQQQAQQQQRQQQQQQHFSPSDYNYSRPSYSYHNDDVFSDSPVAAPSAASATGSSHLSFLYDRAQGPCDNLSATPTTTASQQQLGQQQQQQQLGQQQPMMRQIPNAQDVPLPSGEIMNRAIPAKICYPLPTSHSTAPLENGSCNNSQLTNGNSPCQTGANSLQMTPERTRYNSNQMSDVNRQMSNLSTSGYSPNPNSGSDTSPDPRSSDGHNSSYAGFQRSRMASETNPCKSENSTKKPWSYSPQFGASADPKNVDRPRSSSKSHPIPDYLSFRKFSVPLVSPRPKVQVADYSSDDQLADRSEMRSLERASSEVDHSSVRQLLREGDEIGVYNQKSIRYTGKANPSKMFKLLQAATGSDGEMAETAKLPPRRRTRKPEAPNAAAAAADKEENNADDVVDISYVGGNIPSRTFRILREAMGEPDQNESMSSVDPHDSTPPEQCQGRTVKVIHLRPRKSIDNGITDF